MPSHADWLNDLSSTPPPSVTSATDVLSLLSSLDLFPDQAAYAPPAIITTAAPATHIFAFEAIFLSPFYKSLLISFVNHELHIKYNG